jgi:hypothetical protein
VVDLVEDLFLHGLSQGVEIDDHASRGAYGAAYRRLQYIVVTMLACTWTIRGLILFVREVYGQQLVGGRELDPVDYIDYGD